MEGWIIYSLKAITAGYAFYLVYHFLMKRDTKFRVSRIYLLLSLALSIILPVMSIPGNYKYLAAGISPEFSLSEVIIIPEDNIVADNISLISLIYFIISALLLFRFIYRIAIIAALKHESKKQNINNISYFNITKDLPAFTFLNMIFLNKKNYNQRDIEIILAHEYVHARMYHSLDILFVELLQIVFWFNPALFLYRNALSSIHEYESDRHVLGTGTSFDEYGMLIIKESLNEKSVAFSNNFNSSIIKRRIAMMKRKETGSLSILKPTAGLVIMLALVFVFNLSESATKKQAGAKNTKINPASEFIAEGTPPSCDINELRKNIIYPESARKEGLTCKIFVKAFIDESGNVTKTEASINDNGKNVTVNKGSKFYDFAVAAVKAVKNTKFTPAIKDGKKVGAWMTIPIMFKLADK